MNQVPFQSSYKKRPEMVTKLCEIHGYQHEK